MFVMISCASKNIVIGEIGAKQNITQARRVVVFPFVGDNKKVYQAFYREASRYIWGDRVVPYKTVENELARLGKLSKKRALSRAEVLDICDKLGADTYVVGLINNATALHLKVVDIPGKKEWYRYSDGTSMRYFVQGIYSDILTAQKVEYKAREFPFIDKVAVIPLGQTENSKYAYPVAQRMLNGVLELSGFEVVPSTAVESILKNSFKVSSSSEIERIPLNELAKALSVDAIYELTLTDIDDLNLGIYHSQTVGIKLAVMNPKGECVLERKMAETVRNLNLLPAHSILLSFAASTVASVEEAMSSRGKEVSGAISLAMSKFVIEQWRVNW